MNKLQFQIQFRRFYPNELNIDFELVPFVDGVFSPDSFSLAFLFKISVGHYFLLGIETCVLLIVSTWELSICLLNIFMIVNQFRYTDSPSIDRRSNVANPVEIRTLWQVVHSLSW